MKKIKFLSLMLASIMLLLCACAPSISQPSNDTSPDVPSEISDEPSAESPVESPSEPSDESDDTQPTLDDFWADEASIENKKAALNQYLAAVNTTNFKSSKKLAILSNPAKGGFDEALKLFEYFSDKTHDYNWYELDPLLPECGDLTPEESYARYGDIICVDTDYFVPDGVDDHAAIELLMCNERQLAFHWALPYLAPRFSELCDSEVNQAPTEEQIKAAATMFFKTYFPEFYDDDHSVRIDIKQSQADVYFTKSIFKLDPDAAEERTKLVASVRFSWDEIDLLYANHGHDKSKKAMICDFILYNPYVQEQQCEGYKEVISEKDAFDSYIAAQGADAHALKGNGYKSYIAYKVTSENKIEPYWFFVYLDEESDEFGTFEVQALKK